MVNLIQIVGLFFFGLSAGEFWGWRGVPETPWAYIYLCAFALLIGVAEISRRMPEWKKG